jgi:hypothetical protein
VRFVKKRARRKEERKSEAKKKKVTLHSSICKYLSETGGVVAIVLHTKKKYHKISHLEIKKCNNNKNRASFYYNLVGFTSPKKRVLSVEADMIIGSFGCQSTSLTQPLCPGNL